MKSPCERSRLMIPVRRWLMSKREQKKPKKESGQEERTSKPGALRRMKSDDHIRPKQIEPIPPFMVKMANFRCANPFCDGKSRIRNDIPVTQAKGFGYCSDCGNESMQRVDIYECAECAKQVVVLFNSPAPKTCECGHTKLVKL